MGRDPADHTDRWDRAGASLRELARLLELGRDAAWVLSGFSVRAPQFEGGEYLMTLRSTDAENGRLVAFHSAFDLAELVRGAHLRIKSDTMKWRADEYDR